MADFLFHALSEKEKEGVKREARKVLESFSEKLSHVRVGDEEPIIERTDFERTEKEGNEEEEDFKKRILENAPNKNKDFIIAEKKKWA